MVSQVHKTDLTTLSIRWERILGRLRSTFGDTAFKRWLKPIKVDNLSEDGILNLSVPTQFLENWVKDQYLSQIKDLWRMEDASIQDVKIICKNSLSANDVADTSIVADTSEHEFITDPRFTFDTFVVNKTNELAFTASKRMAQGEPLFNPLFLHGGVGLGKTHLMQAIVTELRKNYPHKKVAYLSAEKFMYQFIRAIRDQDTMSFKDKFRNLDVLLVDDIQFIAGKATTQEEFFHTFNDLIDRKCQVVLTADKSPVYLDGIEERVKSRMGWGMVAEVHTTDYELRLGILQSKVENLDTIIENEILEFLALRITSSVRELEGALNRLVAYASLIDISINMEMVQGVLQDILNANNKRVTVEDIQKQVARHYNIKVSDMHSTRRSRNIARPRQMAIFLAKQLTQHSLPEIGRKFGGRDHSTIIHAVNRIEGLIETDNSIRQDMDILKKTLS